MVTFLSQLRKLRHAMLDAYMEHCNEALKVYGEYAYSGLCSQDHFNIWLMSEKSPDAPNAPKDSWQFTQQS